MSKILIAKVSIFAVMLVVTVPSAFYFMSNIRQPLQSCRSFLVIKHGEFILSSNFSFSFMKEQGIVSVNGTGLADGEKFIIDRSISFSFHTSQNRYMLSSSAIRHFSSDDADVHGSGDHLPAFFTRINSELPLTLEYDTFNTPVLFLAGTPLFYCQLKEEPVKLPVIAHSR